MVGWHHWCYGHELGQTPGDGEGQGGLVCCSPWGFKELEMTWWLNNNNKMKPILFQQKKKRKNLGICDVTRVKSISLDKPQFKMKNMYIWNSLLTWAYLAYFVLSPSFALLWRFSTLKTRLDQPLFNRCPFYWHWGRIKWEWDTVQCLSFSLNLETEGKLPCKCPETVPYGALGFLQNS